MALPTSSIMSVRSNNAEIGAVAGTIEAASNRILQRLQSDPNFQGFITGTEKGAKLNDEFQKLITILVSQLVAGAITPLTSTTARFLEKQEMLNRN